MTQNANGAQSNEADKSPSVAAIEADIAHTRAELADTVDQLAAKLDVKTRTKERIHQTSDQVTETVAGQVHALRDHVTDEGGKPTRTAMGAGGAAVLVVVVVVALVVWRRSR